MLDSTRLLQEIQTTTLPSEPPPLPGGIARVFRFFFTVPQWIQISGAIVGSIVAVIVAVLIWKNRQGILTWLRTRPRQVQGGLFGAFAVAALAAGYTGFASWNYMEHENDFCVACHVMEGAFSKFEYSQHDSLECHDCHQQSIWASARQLYLWVKDRPEEIESDHSPVPNVVCETCHMTGDPSEQWERISTTAGHRAHLESDSTALDEILCVTCHGAELHFFTPVDATCASSGCHETSEIELGGMAMQTSLHCSTCHQFTADVPALATRDSAAGSMTPALDQCLGCHEMRNVLEDFDPALDPHEGTCGTCHNPHTQEIAEDAAATCTDCHDDWESRPFHTGQRHVDVAQQCTLCHEPHRALVDASDCEGCHAGISANPDASPELRQRLRRLAPFDTTNALPQTSSTAIAPRRLESLPTNLPARLGKGDVRIPVEIHPFAADSFSHDEHEQYTCINCHETNEGHGDLRFEIPRGCQLCHHGGENQFAECSSCHEQQNEVETTMLGSIADNAIERSVSFDHVRHADVACADCHADPVSRGSPATTTSCQDCHESHHQEELTCSGCHIADAATEDHSGVGHYTCSECHAEATVALTQPNRALCATCHEPQAQNHYEPRSCSECHMLQSPDELHRRILSGR